MESSIKSAQKASGAAPRRAGGRRARSLAGLFADVDGGYR